MKKNKISKNWINRQKRDIYIRKSNIEGYRSRAVYKLEEINKKFTIFRDGLKVIDLGAAPGSWSQYISKNINNCKLLAIDIKNIETINNTYFLKGDFLDEIFQEKIKKYFNKKVDVVLSDMAANTTGNKNLDSIVTGELCIEAMNFSINILNNNGQFVSKLFMGSIFNEIVSLAKKNFKETHIFKPTSSRKESKECFLICKKLF